MKVRVNGTVTRSSRAAWLITALLLLSAIPLIAGGYRLTELAFGARITPANARFFASPLPVVVHIVSASLFAILGPFQFAAGFLERRLGWHRAAGRILVPSGLLVGLSGLWMTLFYPRPEGTDELLVVLRLIFGAAMVLSILLGFIAILRRDVPRHLSWMMRGYAIGLGAGTQVLTQMAGAMLLGPANPRNVAIEMGAGWIINLAIAEWVIRRRSLVRTSVEQNKESEVQHL